MFALFALKENKERNRMKNKFKSIEQFLGMIWMTAFILLLCLCALDCSCEVRLERINSPQDAGAGDAKND